MADQLSFDEIKSLIALIKEADDLTEFTLKYGDLEISLSIGDSAEKHSGRHPERSPTKVEVVPDAMVAVPTSTMPTTEAVISPEADEIVIRAPMVGTFYRASQPGAPSFVDVGQSVEKDTVVCIIEVMKLMNSLAAGVKGTVTRILVENAQAVEYGQPLMYVRRAE